MTRRRSALARWRDVGAAALLTLVLGLPAAAQSTDRVGTTGRGWPGLDPRRAEPAEGDVPSFTELFRLVGRDLKTLPTRRNLLWLGAGIAGLALEPDDNVTPALAGSAAARASLAHGEWLGGALVQTGGAFAAYAVGRLLDSPSIGTLGADLVRAQLVTQTVTQALKLSVRRQRPDGTSFSFPSGHAAGTFATATVLRRHYGWKAGIPAYAMATYVAAQRLSAERHHLSDVIFGATIGILSARTVTVGLAGTRFAVAPMAVRGGGGVSLVKIDVR